MLEGNLAQCDRNIFSVFAVIVLYGMRPSESAAFRTLRGSISALDHRQIDIRILLYDNTPGGCDPGLLPDCVQYKTATQNAGLAVAYNHALAIAQNEKRTWLLTLDQDTTLPMHYLSRMRKLALDLESTNSVAAIVPRLTDSGRSLSPVSVRFWGDSSLPKGFAGIISGEARALNSASLFRVNALEQIGGFNPYFWLDYLDMHVYWQFHQHGRTIYVAGDIQVEHELSLLHRENLKVDRFQNILQAESAFSDLYGGHIRGLALTGRLLGRIWRQRKRGDAPAIRQLTWNALKARICQSKTRRIKDWKYAMEQRMMCSAGVAQTAETVDERPAISVCMATYNGEQFVHEQIASILVQLGDDDEIVVVDDASVDKTVAIVESFGDKRIHIARQEHNFGVVKTFGRALEEANGEIIFLSDQDDVWAPNRVSRVMRIFSEDPSVSLVLTNGLKFRETGSAFGERVFGGSVKIGIVHTLIKNSYQGSLMAMRRAVVEAALPFPERIPMHDSWIGIVNCVIGKAKFLDENLLYYRRHDGNTTGFRKAGFKEMAAERWQLFVNLLRRYPRLRGPKRKTY